MSAPSLAAPGPALLIAVTGTPGEGRTRLLATLAAEFRTAQKRVEGILAVAGPRAAADTGADYYRLHVLGEAGDLPWVERRPSGAERAMPPYQFHAATRQHLQRWAAHLRQAPPTPLLLLDEFGKFEARGGGLMALWPVLREAAPQIAVLAVRAEFVAEIEAQLGRKFDLCIAAAAADAADQLRRACADFSEWTRLGLWGGAAGGIEMSVGSLLHATRVPLRGLALSSLQAAIMTFASVGLSRPGRVVWVPFISAGLKAFSPGGGRIRPMVAIGTQGALFSASVQLLGRNFFSVALGGVLIGAWAALQGFLLQYLLLGEELLNAYRKLVAWLAENWQVTAPSMVAVLVAWAALHAVAAASAALVAWRLRQPPRALQAIIEREIASINTVAAPASTTAPQRRERIVRELLRWQFWLPFGAVAGVLLITGGPWESVAWLALRFVAVGFVLVGLLSLFKPAWLAERLRRRGWWGPAAAFAGALRRGKN
ncbi:MAG: hypothetical protein Q8M02_04130 [Candidatus Didemnitutus sp.]|nr:hypothetical protein [Candidatus Didemnitutus sp.]